ncbi:sulfatase-like hydrolase/transferase [Paenibacillus mendelii]|uniref:Sulfatase-like hydrolase/transferase n=1 Tax=Paenibacillus mendelii TaxID=206163 RepID=A0ABV6J8Y8_9BACL|nr:sulfatase-like hydrolase/transferase [Paenibacillus mendelii]MCQ6560063.1 sulfatase-like hydrolase/transferase [Paenibacillus mendelii]
MAVKPNILFILSDQHRYDCIGSSRDYPVKTPNLDRLADDGIRFTNAYTPIPLCCPARQSLLSGVRPESFESFWNADLVPNKELEPTAYTWPKELRDSGYRTGYVGKWHVNQDYSPAFYGFDDYVGEHDYRLHRQEAYPEAEFTNGYIGEVDRVALQDTRTHWLASRAVELVEQYTAEDKPWHIRLDFPEPHLPCQPHQSYLDLYEGEVIPEWRSFSETFLNKPYIQKQQLLNWRIEDYTWQDWEPIVRRYYAIISQMDAAIGMVLDKLRELGIEDNTIVVYTSDHGDLCGGHRMMDKHYILYDDVVRVPFIMKYPRSIHTGQTSEQFVYNLLDLPPTLLQLTGLPAKAFFHGQSLVPLFEGDPPEDWRTEVISTYNGQQFGLFNQRMIRSSHWKYIWNLTDIDELYDLLNDPDELTNVIGEKEYEETLSELRQKLYAELKQHQDPFLRLDYWLKGQLSEGRKLSARA